MTETWTGRAACLLLALVWFVSMGVADANAYSYVPLLAGLIVVILLALSAMIRGAKVVQLSKTAWISLGVGVYFLVRCLCSFSVVESWREASIILGCGVFYVAGVYAAQGHSPRPIIWTIGAALLLNMLYFALMHYTDIPLEWSGRPSTGPGGSNHRPVTLFVYKNFAGAFLLVSGFLITALALWCRHSLPQRLLWSSVGIAAMLLSTECSTRSIYLLAPLLFILGVLVWFSLKLNEHDELRVRHILIGFALLSACCILMGWALMDPDCINYFSAQKSNGRFTIWGLVCRILPDAPLWGYGACSVQWMTLPWNDQSYESINFAHNEYLQAWCDYGSIGLFAMVGIIFWHSCRVFYILSEDCVPATQKRMSAVAVLCLLAWSVGACVDFFWHHFAIAGMTAFALGIIASPYPSENARKGKKRKVVPQGPAGKSALALCCAGSLTLAGLLTHKEWPVWLAQWEYNTLANADEGGHARRDLLAKLIPSYPASELMDTYMLLPTGEKIYHVAQETALLRTVLRSNPHQLHIAMRLAARLSESGKYEEAEALFRRVYPGDGPSCTRLADWAMPYTKHLFRRGQHCLYTGEREKGTSLLRYAMKIVDKEQLKRSRRWRFGGVWMPPDKEEQMRWEKYLRARQQDLRISNMLKVEPDDSWQAPDASGKPALYRRYGAPESLEKADSAASAPAAAKKE